MKKSSSVFFLLLSLCVAAMASGPSVWSVNSRAEILKGDARGVSIDDSGTITLAPKLSEVFRTDQPYIWSSAADSAGNVYLGTGADGKVFKVDAAGKGSLFSDLPELNVTAIAIGKGGEIFAATSPDGKVYRLDAAGTSSVYFDPKQKYIWSLAVMPDGTLAVGTGDSGRIYRVRSANAASEASLLFDTSETNITSLAVDRSGNLYAGTDPSGLVIRFGADGKPFGVLDSSLREIHELSVAGDGSIYALALSESTGAAKPAEAAAAGDNKPVSADKAGPATESTSTKSRYDLSTAKSVVYRMLPDGGSDVLWTSVSPAFSLVVQPSGGVMVGTSDKGRIYSVTNEGRETLLLQSDASQISTIKSVGQNLIATSSNQGVLYRIGFDPATEGTYESSVLDAKSAARWGRIWWRSSGNVQIQTRSGNTAKPDETWSAWSAPSTSGQVASPKARFLQWRAVLKNAGARANLNEVNVAFVARNIAPEVLSIQVLPTNVGLVPNPAPQIDPNIQLSGLDPATFGIPSASVPPRRVYQRAARSFQWTAEDRNGDDLVYDVFYKEVSEASWRPLRQNITETFLTVDGQSLSDGKYVFRIVAKDAPSNPESLSLSGERTTDPIEIDNTPPTVTAGNGGAGQVIFSAADKSSYLVRAEYSINGGDWKTVYADDGISDSPNETYTVSVPSAAGEYSVTIRVFDASGNAGNARAVIRR